MTKKILIVEDELDLAEVVAYNLRANGLEVVCATSSHSARALLQEHTIDCVVLDLMLPDESGIALLKHIRTEFGDRYIPVIICSARAEEFDRIVAFELGADDYLTKPVSLAELRLRVGGLLKQSTSDSAEDCQQLGELAVYPSSMRVTVSDQEIDLSISEFRIIELLLRRQGKVLSRAQLLEAARPDAEKTQERTVDTHIKRIRKKLGPAGDYIVTRRGFGYSMTLN